MMEGENPKNPQKNRSKITLAKHVCLNAHNNKVKISIGMVKLGQK